ncbi:MAG: response regulator [Planctomycetota bacterium]|nr:response regulator [Planctomycetota bacterium]
MDAKILVIDDEPEVACLLCEFFKMLGCETRMVNSGGAAIEAIRADHPNLVLLDLNLGKESGLEVLKQLNQHFQNLRVYMTSGYQESEELEKAIQLGAKGNLSKPFGVDRLQAILESEQLK